VGARLLSVSLRGSLHQNQITRIAQDQHMTVHERAAAHAKTVLTPLDLAGGDVHAFQWSFAMQCLPANSVKKSVGTDRGAPVVRLRIVGCRPQLRGVVMAAGPGDFA